MVQSMTGFATTQLELSPAPGIIIPATMTIKALNSKFFETTCRMPHILAPIEHIIIQRCKESLKRGTITVTIQLSNISSALTSIQPSLRLAQEYLKSAQDIQKTCNISGELTIADLMRLPNLFETIESPLQQEVFDEILTHCDRLLAELVQGRIQEGAALERDIKKLFAIISSCVDELAPRAEYISQERRERFLKEVTAVLSSAPEEVKHQHVQALYQHINAIDTHEEIVRLRAHCETFLQTLQDTEIQKGKKLDFILQELFREINTLNAKLADTSSMGSVLTIKTKLEQAREQAQNIV